MQEQFQIGGVKGTLSWFIDHRFTRQWLEFWDDLPASLPAHKNLAARPEIANSSADALTSPSFILGQVREVGTVTFAGMHHVITESSSRVQNFLDRADWRAGK